jgi:hypothetical protein
MLGAFRGRVHPGRFEASPTLQVSSTTPGGPGGPGPPVETGPVDVRGASDVAGAAADASIVSLAVTVATGLTLVFASVFFGRRRRSKGPAAPDPSPAREDLAAATFDPGTGGTDIDLPRWRRPSLMAARKSDPVHGGLGAVGSLTFSPDQAVAAGRERCRVGYRIVRLLDRPDELAGETVGSVDQGDEVEILEKHGLYRRVTTPDGRSGWLHKMTLGDLIEEPEAEPELDEEALLDVMSRRATDATGPV